MGRESGGDQGRKRSCAGCRVMAVPLAKKAHEVAYDDLVALLGKHAADVNAFEMLAIASNMVGKLVALQDQRTVTVDQALEIVSLNLEIGNQQGLDRLSAAGGPPS